MNSFMTKDDFVVIDYCKVITLVSCDKCFYIATMFSAYDQLKEGFLSRQRKLCRDIKFIIQNKGQQGFVVTKKFSVVTNKT